MEESTGIGDHTVARLLGHTGHPRLAVPMKIIVREDVAKKTRTETELRPKDQRRRVAVPDGDPYDRMVSQWWSYCGVGDPERRIQAKMSQEDLLSLGKPQAKSLTFLMATGCVKTASGHYRKFYDAEREKYEGHVHARECVRCGPAGKPAQIGAPWSKGHQFAAALRNTGKEILKDIWVYSGE